jgi:drug/metabolite transporter (DMT)-like permease
VFYAETVLSLTPILIKLVPTNLTTQTLARFLIYPIAALAVGGFKPLTDLFKSGGQSLLQNLGLGSLNVAHVASSYLAFSELPAGIAMALFYTYPLWNLIGASAVFGEAFPWHLLPVVAVALAGTFMVASQAKDDDKKSIKFGQINWKGVAAALIAALTETGLFLTVRGTGQPTPFHNIHQFYLSGLPFIFLIYALFKGNDAVQPIDWNWRHWLPLIAFNGVLGFTGYTARFWSIPRLPTIVYTVLSMFGVVAAFVWGHIFVGEAIRPVALAGAGLLTGAIGYLRFSAA